MKTSPIIALDFPSAEKTFEFLQAFNGGINVKVGMELFYKEGPRIVEQLKARNYDVFLDLKLHDIPHTVKSAMAVLASVGADMVNVHAAGCKMMMEAALEGLEQGTPSGMKKPSLIAVTQLTSTDERQVREEQRISVSLEESVLHYAKLAQEANLQGVVCSVHEANAIREICGQDFYKVTPGIRLTDGNVHDQKRIATPTEAKINGSTHIVVGRAITNAADPRAAYDVITAQWEG